MSGLKKPVREKIDVERAMGAISASGYLGLPESVPSGSSVKGERASTAKRRTKRVALMLEESQARFIQEKAWEEGRHFNRVLEDLVELGIAASKRP